jgi:DNA-directed RNA polymerase specialized sigma24 family protein
VSGYQRELIERLIPTLWDETYAYGMSNPNQADADMPKVKTAKNETCTLFAHLADIKAAWQRAELRDEERAVLLLQYGLDWSQDEIALHQGVTQQAVSYRAKRGVGLLMAWLNGSDYTDSASEAEESA